MEYINATSGRLALGDLGRTLMHEHVLVGFPGWYLDNRKPKFQREEAMSRVVDAFQKVHDYGVRSVVDPCPMDLGRDVEFCAKVAQRSRINLICTTGVYFEEMGLIFAFKSLSVEAITEIYIKEIEDGIGHTGIKAGLIKIATGEGKVTDYERKCLTAAARASKATGVPLISHTQGCSCGHDQIDIVTAEGLPPCRLLVGHSDEHDDPDYQQALAKRGAYVGFDRFGLTMIIPDEIRVKNLKLMVDAGYIDRIMMSHDSVQCILPDLPSPDDAIHKIAPNWRLTHIFENIFPQLRALGMSDAALDNIVIDNPKRFFAEASGVQSKVA